MSDKAGFSPTEVRRYQLAVKRIQEERNAKAAKFEGLTANLDTVKHDAVAREINKYIHVVSGLLSMDETSTTESINWASEKHGLSDIDEIDQMIEDAVQTSDPCETYGSAGSGRSRSSMAASYNDASQGGDGR